MSKKENYSPSMLGLSAPIVKFRGVTFPEHMCSLLTSPAPPFHQILKATQIARSSR